MRWEFYRSSRSEFASSPSSVPPSILARVYLLRESTSKNAWSFWACWRVKNFLPEVGHMCSIVGGDKAGSKLVVVEWGPANVVVLVLVLEVS